jgi:hypothetical protein
MGKVMHFVNKIRTISLLLLPFIAAYATSPTLAAPAAVTTLDVCKVGASGLWRYSGVVAVADTRPGIAMSVRVQNKVVGDFIDIHKVSVPAGRVSTAGTGFAKVLPFSVDALPLMFGSIRNAARVSLSGDLLGEPTFTVTEQIGVCHRPATTCTRMQAIWINQPGPKWPSGFDRQAKFFSSGLTLQQVLDMPAQDNGYLILAQHSIVAALNVAGGTAQQAGIRSTLQQASAYFAGGATPASCPPGQCALQKSWAAVLDSYNSGAYPGGPKLCAA